MWDLGAGLNRLQQQPAQRASHQLAGLPIRICDVRSAGFRDGAWDLFIGPPCARSNRHHARLSLRRFTWMTPSWKSICDQVSATSSETRDRANRRAGSPPRRADHSGRASSQPASGSTSTGVRCSRGRRSRSASAPEIGGRKHSGGDDAASRHRGRGLILRSNFATEDTKPAKPVGWFNRHENPYSGADSNRNRSAGPNDFDPASGLDRLMRP